MMTDAATSVDARWLLRSRRLVFGAVGIGGGEPVVGHQRPVIEAERGGVIDPGLTVGEAMAAQE